MKIKFNKLILTAALIGIILIILFAVFQTRSPVLIVIDESFINLYGTKRLRNQTISNSLVMFRNVKTVSVANDVSDDMIPFAVQNFSSQPYCVLFPMRFAKSAEIYHALNPDIRVVILEGRNSEDINTSANLFRYKTDIETDFYKAGIVAASIKSPVESVNEDSDDVVIKRYMIAFLEPLFNRLHGTKVRSSFLKGINEDENPPEVWFYTAFSDYYQILGLSCIILAGSGAEYLENTRGIPVILYSWLDPSLAPANVILIIDDSPWAQAVQAVKLAVSGEEEGLIKSKFLIPDAEKIDKTILRKIR
ncbi:MAG: hypothetical protein FWC22_03465 [Treponema sp.]|nr:hypothetical protein [Treponema sp.]